MRPDIDAGPICRKWSESNGPDTAGLDAGPCADWPTSDWPATASASATPKPINACCFIESLQEGNRGMRDYIGIGRGRQETVRRRRNAPPQRLLRRAKMRSAKAFRGNIVGREVAQGVELRKTVTVKSGLMSDLFTGRVRVPQSILAPEAPA